MRISEIIETFGFVKKTSDHGVDFWTGQDFSDWSEGNRIGQQRAQTVIDYTRCSGDPVLFSRVLQAMVEKGDFGAIEVGFALGIVGGMMASRPTEAKPIEDADVKTLILRAIKENGGSIEPSELETALILNHFDKRQRSRALRSLVDYGALRMNDEMHYEFSPAVAARIMEDG